MNGGVQPVQVVLGLAILAALTATVLGYPNRYGAQSGRSRLFRTVGMCLLDLLLMLALLATLIDWRAELNAPGATPASVALRFGLFVGSLLFLCFALFCTTLLDALESFTVTRKERRQTLESMLREQVEAARAEAARRELSDTEKTPSPAKPDDPA